jgi:hypothetical protein
MYQKRRRLLKKSFSEWSVVKTEAKHLETEPKTLQSRGFKPLNGAQKEFFNTLVRFRYSTLQRELPPIGGRLPSVSSPVLFLGKLLEKEGRCKKRSEDPDSDRGHNSLDRGGLPAPFQAQALKRPSLGPALLTQLPSSGNCLKSLGCACDGSLRGPPKRQTVSSRGFLRTSPSQSSPKFAPGIGGWHHALTVVRGVASAKGKRGRKGEPTCRSRRRREGPSRRPSNAGTHWSKGSSEAASGSWRS